MQLLMTHENQYAGILWAIVIIVSLEKKERTVKGDQCDSTKDSPTVKLIFSLEHKDGKQ